MSKKTGDREISVDQIVTIVKMSGDGTFRSSIADEVNLSENTVYRWQKRFDLL